LESDPTLGLELPGETSNLDMDYHIQTPEDVEKTKAPNQTFYIYGTVVYADIFRVKRHTTFCSFWNPDGGCDLCNEWNYPSVC